MVAAVARRLGPKAGVALGVAAALLGLSVSAATMSDQAALAHGATSEARVVSLHDDRSRADIDTVEAALEPSGRHVVLTHYRGRPQVGDRITVIYDPADPATAAEQGVSLWGAFELLMTFVGLAGLVTLPIEWRRMRRPKGHR
jgi:hypothetical protein